MMIFRRAFQAVLGLSLFVFATLSLGALLLGLRLGVEVYGQLRNVNAMKDEPLELASEVYDESGQTIGEFAGERRYFVPLSDLPPKVVQAFLSAEDKSFYTHMGINLRAIARSAVADLRGGALKQGASTITQQLARLTFLDQRKTWERKAKEALLAILIERKLSKNEILELYLNRIYLGNHSYGIEAAARNYFRKHAADLDVGEAALLAGLPQSPSRYAPNRHAKRANARQRIVLTRMAEDGALTAEEADRWAARPVEVAAGPEDFSTLAPYFIAAVQKELGQMFESQTLPLDGLRVYTTLDSHLQASAAHELREATQAARQEAAFKRKHKGGIEGALVSLDPRTGAVLAMQGGASFGRSQFNRSAETRRRLAALFVPIEVSLALERGFTVTSRIGDDPMSGKRLPASSGVPTLYQVIAKGMALEAAPLYAQLGSGSVVELARRLGMHLGREDMGLALGYGEASPLEAAVAYGAFVNGGRTLAPYLVSRVETADGHVVYEAPPPEGVQALTPQTAYIVSQALTGHGMRAATDDLQDAWYVGTQSNIVTAIWIGAENGQARLAATDTAASAFPANAWAAYMDGAPARYRDGGKPLAAPPGVSFVRPPDGAGGDGDGAPRSLPYLSGSEPRGAKERVRF